MLEILLWVSLCVSLEALLDEKVGADEENSVSFLQPAASSKNAAANIKHKGFFNASPHTDGYFIG